MAILTDPKMIKLFQMRTQLTALYLEIKGLKSRRGSICATIKKQNNIKKRNKTDVYREFHKIIIQKEKELGIPERKLNNTEKEILE